MSNALWRSRCLTISAFSLFSVTVLSELLHIKQNAQLMAKIAAERMVRHLEHARFVVMRRAPISGSAPTRA
jgi:hypothetical protein